MDGAADNAGSIYLSPHRDDAAFSLGGLIARAPGGTLVNIFTRSEYTAVPLELPEGAVRADRVSALRAAEDAGFIARFGFTERDLGLEEPSLRGCEVFTDGVPDASDLALLRLPLTRLLDELLAAGPRRIYCPAGIGRHVDHLLTCSVALEWARSRGQLGQLRFYEDLPYATRRSRRARGLKRLRAEVGVPLRRAAWPVGEDKLAALALYVSQHRSAPTLTGFRPAAFWPLGPHEAVWAPLTHR
jgi:LmbE family N-acetylglucosaminyl deacetylase